MIHAFVSRARATLMTHTPQLCAALCALALAAPMAGCSRPFEPATPSSFVELDDQGPTYDYRATTADGVVLAARAVDNDPEGTPAFWVEAVERRMQSAGGYTLLEKREVSCQEGLKGTQLRFVQGVSKEPHLYYVTVFVTKKRIFVLEAGGTKEQIERFEEPIAWSITNFKLK